MKRILYLITTTVFLQACNLTGVEQQEDKQQDKVDFVEQEQNDTLAANEGQEVETKDTVIMEKELANGIRINWLKKGEGKSLKNNDLVRISYQNCLEDGTVYDANAMIKKTSVPFMLGWGLQTPGWDIAFRELKVGDEVDIFIPAELARGEKGIPGIVPPNANNILKVNIKEVMPPSKILDGIKIWVVDSIKQPGDSIQYKSTVEMHYWAHTKTTPRYDNSYMRRQPFELVMGDGNIVPGLYKALHFLRKGDKAMIYIPSQEAYGKKGLTDLVASNEDLLYDVMIVSVSNNEKK